MPKKTAFCVVYAHASKHAKKYEFYCPAIIDPKITLAIKLGATVTTSSG